MTNFFEAGKIPEIRKITALLRLHGLDRAIVAMEKNTFAIRLLLQGKTTPIFGEPGEFLNEIELGQTFVSGQSRDLHIGQTHLSRPATTSRAALTFVKDRHEAEPSVSIVSLSSRGCWCPASLSRCRP